jgi:hypothetical protein
MAQTPPADDPHSEAYKTLHLAIMNPATRESAKNHPIVGPIAKKLSLRDWANLKKIAENNQVSVCCPGVPKGAP